MKDGAFVKTLSDVFDLEGYIESFSPAERPFAQGLAESQMFSDFILARITEPEGKEIGIFFDWAVALSRQEWIYIAPDDPNRLLDLPPLHPPADQLPPNMSRSKLRSSTLQVIKNALPIYPAAAKGKSDREVIERHEDLAKISLGGKTSDKKNEKLYEYENFPKLDFTVLGDVLNVDDVEKKKKKKKKKDKANNNKQMLPPREQELNFLFNSLFSHVNRLVSVRREIEEVKRKAAKRSRYGINTNRFRTKSSQVFAEEEAKEQCGWQLMSVYQLWFRYTYVYAITHHPYVYIYTYTHA